MLVLKNERLVWKQLCARNMVFNRLEALHRKPSLSIAFNTRSKTNKYICALNFYQATWLTYRERWFKWVTAIRITLIISEFANLCAGSIIILAEFSTTSTYLVKDMQMFLGIVLTINQLSDEWAIVAKLLVGIRQWHSYFIPLCLYAFFYTKDEVTVQRIELLTWWRGKTHSLTAKQHKQTSVHQNSECAGKKTLASKFFMSHCFPVFKGFNPFPPMSNP